MPPEQNPHSVRPQADRVPETEDPLRNNTPSERDQPLTQPPNAGLKKPGADVPSTLNRDVAPAEPEETVEVTEEIVLLEDLSKGQLKDLAKEKGLPVGGTKADLIERLT